MLRGRHTSRRLWHPRTRSIQLLDAPVEVAYRTRRWLRGMSTEPDRPSNRDYHKVVADQIHELACALHRTTAGLVAIVDQMLATDTARERTVERCTVTIDVTGPHGDTRATADILATIDHLAVTGDSTGLATPADARSMVNWIADEIDAQSDGRPPNSYATLRHRPSPPCPLLRAAETHDLGQVTVHAYRHSGLSGRQISAVRGSKLAEILSEAPGATFDEALSWLSSQRMDLLTELGTLIQLGAVFGIDHQWYPYDILSLALFDGDSAQRSCACPSAPASAR
jgi:hypothetical protein